MWMTGRFTKTASKCARYDGRRQSDLTRFTPGKCPASRSRSIAARNSGVGCSYSGSDLYLLTIADPSSCGTGVTVLSPPKCPTERSRAGFRELEVFILQPRENISGDGRNVGEPSVFAFDVTNCHVFEVRGGNRHAPIAVTVFVTRFALGDLSRVLPQTPERRIELEAEKRFMPHAGDDEHAVLVFLQQAVMQSLQRGAHHPGQCRGSGAVALASRTRQRTLGHPGSVPPICPANPIPTFNPRGSR